MRVPDEQINKWLIEDLTVKIKQKAIDYLLLHEEPITDEQFIIIPYPVFHKKRRFCISCPALQGGLASRTGRMSFFCLAISTVFVVTLSFFGLGSTNKRKSTKVTGN